MMLYVRNLDVYEFDPPFSFGSGGVAVELGAGMGVAGLTLAAAYLHAKVVLTDLPEVCPLLQANARGCPGVTVRPLTWGCAAHAQALRDELGPLPISHVICSDLVCQEPLLPNILSVLNEKVTYDRCTFSNCLRRCSVRSYISPTQHHPWLLLKWSSHTRFACCPRKRPSGPHSDCGSQLCLCLCLCVVESQSWPREA